jgi:hypothetical protein
MTFKRSAEIIQISAPVCADRAFSEAFEVASEV